MFSRDTFVENNFLDGVEMISQFLHLFDFLVNKPDKAGVVELLKFSRWFLSKRF